MRRAPESAEERQGTAVLGLVGMLIGCMLFSLFPSLLSGRNDPRPIRARAIVTKVEDFIEGSKIVTYQVDDEPHPLTQPFTAAGWPGLTVGSEVEIAYNARNGDAAYIATGTAENAPIAILGRSLIFGASLLTLLYIGWNSLQRNRRKKKDVYDPTTL
jgi:hypothetical protein